jgi:hypothetical protein
MFVEVSGSTKTQAVRRTESLKIQGFRDEKLRKVSALLATIASISTHSAVRNGRPRPPRIKNWTKKDFDAGGLGTIIWGATPGFIRFPFG